MGPDDSDAEAEGEQRSQTVFLIGLGAALIGFSGLMNVFYWFSGHGAFFSIVSAFHAAATNVPVIDVDSSGFRFPMLVIATVVGLALCGRIGVDLKRGGTIFVSAVAIMFASYFVAAAIGEPILDRVMAAYDYRRCALGDHIAGIGKGRVSFRRYVSRSTNCISA